MRSSPSAQRLTPPQRTEVVELPDDEDDAGSILTSLEENNNLDMDSDLDPEMAEIIRRRRAQHNDVEIVGPTGTVTLEISFRLGREERKRFTPAELREYEVARRATHGVVSDSIILDVASQC